MAAPKVRADYEQLKSAASRFSTQAQAARQSLQALQREIDVLQGGDWVGGGAAAFYQEMGSSVLPTLKRLAAALETAQQTTLQIHQVMAQAEAEAARWLNGEGVGLAAALAGAAAAGAAGPGAGSGSGAAGAGAAGGGAQAAPGDTPLPKPFVDAIAKLVAEENAAVDSKLSMFSQGVRDMVKKSPTLRSQIFQLEKNGFNFKTGPVADGYYMDPNTKTIVIDQPLGDADTVSHIAHEVGHGVNAQKIGIPATPTMTRDEYVRLNVNNLMQNEGEAQLNAAQIRAELKAAGGPDIGIPGSQTAKYQAVYDDYAAGKVTRAEAVNRMATLMGNERVSTPPHQPYRDSYRDAYRKDWDDNIAPTRKP